MSIKNDGHYFCRAGGNRPDGLNEPVTHNLPVAPNLLNQTFAPTAPNQVWVADLTYVATQEGWLYLTGIKDVYTCEIVGYAMGERMTKELTGKALFMALRSQVSVNGAPY
ncbi:IS600 ORF2 domain protein [Escherichia coli 3431]|nr:IS600 ORF2 domain protein [Escherichia coli 3431]